MRSFVDKVMSNINIMVSTSVFLGRTLALPGHPAMVNVIEKHLDLLLGL